MIKLLILGSNGMLGSACEIFFSRTKGFDCYTCSRKSLSLNMGRHFVFQNAIHDIPILLGKVKFDFVINCIGDTSKGDFGHEQSFNMLQINARFPRVLAHYVDGTETRVLHVSTDCVFSGRKGGYNENDVPDPLDLYGMSKLLGECCNANFKTIRTSIVGPEMGQKNRGLFSWFLSQRGKVDGYKNAYFSGVTTWELASQLRQLIEDEWFDDADVMHVFGPRISKYDLLTKFKDHYNVECDLVAYDNPPIDRSLSSVYRSQVAKTWEEMLLEQKQYVIF